MKFLALTAFTGPGRRAKVHHNEMHDCNTS